MTFSRTTNRHVHPAPVAFSLAAIGLLAGALALSLPALAHSPTSEHRADERKE